RAIDGRLVAATPLVPDGASVAGGVIVLEDVRTEVERRLIATWLDSAAPPELRSSTIERFKIGDPRLAERLARGDDPLVVPVKVVWVPRPRGESRLTHLLDLVTLNDPRSPHAYRQVDILRRVPDRCRLVAAGPATAGELRARCAERSGGNADP